MSLGLDGIGDQPTTVDLRKVLKGDRDSSSGLGGISVPMSVGQHPKMFTLFFLDRESILIVSLCVSVLFHGFLFVILLLW